MIQLAQVFRFPGKLLFIIGIESSLASRSHGILIAPVDVTHEEFLNGDLHGGFQRTQGSGYFYLRRSQVGDAERALP